MRSRWLLFAALFPVLGGINAVGQDEAPPGEGRGQPPGASERKGRRPGGPMDLSIEKLKKELKLSDEQCTRLKPLLERIKAVFEEMRKETGTKQKSRKKSGSGGKSGRHENGDREAMKKKMDAVRKKLLEIIAPAETFLRPEQFKALKEKLTRRPGPPPEGQGGRRGHDGGGDESDDTAPAL